MTYTQLWQSFTPRYDVREAQAVARMLLDVAFGLSLTDVALGAVERLAPGEEQRLAAMAQRVAAGEPVQYVTGLAFFGPLQFRVGPGVLIPRPETFGLCQWVEQELRRLSSGGLRLLDAGTGSGCIAVTLSKALPEARVTAWDVSPRALDCARSNAALHGVSIDIAPQDMLAAPAEDEALWDAIVSNPPYVMQRERGEMEPHVVDHEPHSALFVPDDDPLRFYDALIRYARHALRPDGKLFFELNPLTAGELSQHLSRAGFLRIETRPDDEGRQRMLCASRS